MEIIHLGVLFKKDLSIYEAGYNGSFIGWQLVIGVLSSVGPFPIVEPLLLSYTKRRKASAYVFGDSSKVPRCACTYVTLRMFYVHADYDARQRLQNVYVKP
mmetsp:Transcript_8077/g.15874  ORF Transcript_8077/g.15874 Transcript_8077/m.15874 type:complete len:101 (+) Transcript_8077:402-704(+)